MKTKKKICARLFRRYQKASKKDKGKILQEYAQLLGYNRDYLALLLANWGKTRYALSGGKALKYIAKPPVKTHRKALGGTKTGRPQRYHKACVQALQNIWEFFDFQCGKLLAPLIRGMIEWLVIEFQLNPHITRLLMQISPATIDRKLKKYKKLYRLKSRSTTKRGTLLKNQIPIRVRFKPQERTPGFFEADTVSHCGLRASGPFCQSLVLTDVGSGWTEPGALVNSAHRWVKEHIVHIHKNLPFPLLGIDSDNGGEFINHQLLDWCIHNTIKFTRTRSYHKNDNCFVEQKNGDVVRKTVGYARFEGEEAHKALADVYQALSPLLNYWYPTLQLVAKERLPSGRYKKIYAKNPKTPYQRLLESADVSEESKAELRSRRALQNPIALKHALNEARQKLLKLSQI
jgi:hypothetical protein